MKTTLFTILGCLLLTFGVTAQVQTPAPSPSAEIEQTVGLTEIEVEYSRPSVKGRVVFGDLVPYGEKWRTGANAATKVSFSTDVVVGGVDVPEGEYALLTVPNESEWELHFYTYTQPGVGNYFNSDETPIVTKTTGVNELPFTMESFMIAFDNLRNSSADMHLVWENTNAYVTIEVPTEEAVMASIESTMAGPSANDYRAAAGYYLEEGKDMEQALEWINKSLEMGGDRFWILQDKSEIQAALGDYKGAIETAKHSKDLAREAGNNDYIKINDKNIAKWANK